MWNPGLQTSSFVGFGVQTKLNSGIRDAKKLVNRQNFGCRQTYQRKQVMKQATEAGHLSRANVTLGRRRQRRAASLGSRPHRGKVRRVTRYTRHPRLTEHSRTSKTHTVKSIKN